MSLDVRLTQAGAQAYQADLLSATGAPRKVRRRRSRHSIFARAARRSA